MSANETKMIEMLARIEKVLEQNGLTQAQILACLNTDRSNMWKILTITIIGAFAIIGVKLAFP